jgi:hypothetical protein
MWISKTSSQRGFACPHLVLVEIQQKFRIQLHQVTSNSIVQIGKFIWAINSRGGRPTANVFMMHYEMHYQQKKIKLEGSENMLAAQFGCITFHPSHYGGRAKLTPVMKNKWSSGWARNWFCCKVPSQKLNVRGRGAYPLRSEMSALEYWTDATYTCAADDTNLVDFAQAATIIEGHDAVEEFLACDIWPLNDNCEFLVEMKESPLSKDTVLMPKVTTTIGEKETLVAFKAQSVAAANVLVGNYSPTEHRASTMQLQHG